MTIYLGIDSVCYHHTLKSKKLDLVGFLDRAKLYNARAVQMDPLWPSQGLGLSSTSLDYLSNLLTERNLRIIVKGNSGGLGSLAKPPSMSSEELAIFIAKIKAAASLCSPIVRIVTRAYPYPTNHTTPPSGVPRREVIGWVIENLRVLTAVAEAATVKLVIENHGDLRIAEIEQILEEVNSKSLGVQYDLLEQVAIFEDPYLAAERLLPHAFTVHWNDAYPILSDSGFCVTACPPGKGIIDLECVFNMLAAQNRDVYVFTAFQADTEENEDTYVKLYLDDLQIRLKQIK